MANRVFISGTPGVGKSTIANKLSDELNAKLIDVKKLAIENDLILGIDPEKGYKIVDVEAFDSFLQNLELEGFIIVESHLSHLFSNPDKVIVLRVDPDILKGRLSSRDYSDSKIRENLEAEALGVCSIEAFELHGKKVSEINTSNLSVSESVNIIIDVIEGNNNFLFGQIDFMDWLIKNP
ncbi:adenylate kinase family protein [Methanobrevibacter oralis]|uniref:Putative adenylate kinase n=1 Tax=Methanobrevibacter oralis TaxID=66851 RepID=A0A166BY24_METOA|nr:adenylate kinase family protein [Methanobrevibacter oralis]KZX13934.1 cytidylate kinase [Methanobrevibacter oralis]